MWFASIWIFTLQLPWRLEADFFYRHLLDGDAASNTCSWGWVAGLHTRSKPYEAQAWNIEQFTANRFSPDARDLAQNIVSLGGQEPAGLPELKPIRLHTQPSPSIPTLVILTDEDYNTERYNLVNLNIAGSTKLMTSDLRSSLPIAKHITDFEAAALCDAEKRLGLTTQELSAGSHEKLLDMAIAMGSKQIAMP